MSVSYTILFESEESIDVVKAQLENLISTTFNLSENWEYFDLYYTEVLGLWIQFHDRRDGPVQDDHDISLDSYQIQVGYLREKTGLSEGKDWVRTAIVQLARMITRNMECNSIVMAEDVITHRFEV